MAESKFNPLIQKLSQNDSNSFSAIQVLKIDNRREYFNSILGPYLLENGIVSFSSCNDTPWQNGVAKIGMGVFLGTLYKHF